MGIREQMGERRTLTIAIVAVAIIVFGVVVWRDFFPSDAIRPISKAYFTTDDSSVEAATAALFVDGAEKLPPFTHDGKEAYRAFVFSTDSGKTKFVGYLERFTTHGPTQSAAIPTDMSAVEYKKPGDRVWTKAGDRIALSAVMEVKPPSGAFGSAVLVNP